MTLIDLQGHFSCLCLKINVPYFSSLLVESQGDQKKDDIVDDLE